MVVSPVQIPNPQQRGVKGKEVLKQVFASVDAASCPTEYNFHMHTVCSDGRLTPGALMEQVFALGLKGFSITDHHTLNGYYQAKQWLEDWQWRHPAPIKGGGHVSLGRRGTLPRLFTGIEITSLLLGIEVHILGYAFDPLHPAIQPYVQGHAPQGKTQQADAVIGALQAAGGLAVLAHPARYRRSPADLIEEAVPMGIDGVETFYAYDNPEVWRPCPKQTPLIQELARHYELLSTCGTDTHGLTLTRRL